MTDKHWGDQHAGARESMDLGGHGIIAPASPAANQRDDEERLEDSFISLRSTIMEVPVEDCVPHQGEEIVADILVEHGEEAFASQLLGFANNGLAADAMLLAGRLPRFKDKGARRTMVSAGLSSGSLRMRDAAIQMVERWEDRECLDLLAGHEEPDGFISKYKSEVIEYLRS